MSEYIETLNWHSNLGYPYHDLWKIAYLFRKCGMNVRDAMKMAKRMNVPKLATVVRYCDIPSAYHVECAVFGLTCEDREECTLVIEEMEYRMKGDIPDWEIEATLGLIDYVSLDKDEAFRMDTERIEEERLNNFLRELFFRI